jgi:hypothetical protein
MWMSCTEVAPQVRVSHSHNHRLAVPLVTTLHVAITKKGPPIAAASSYNANYLLRPLQALNLNEPIRVAQLKLPVVA